ncbi:hypothetical protein DSUL_60275 [Desulfovibrionales bacterium]
MKYMGTDERYVYPDRQEEDCLKNFDTAKYSSRVLGQTVVLLSTEHP